MCLFERNDILALIIEWFPLMEYANIDVPLNGQRFGNPDILKVFFVNAR